MRYFEEFIDDLKNFNFNGRLNRARYWMYAICGYLMLLAIYFILGILGLSGTGVPSIINACYAILFLPFNVRRLHDLNHGGLWLLLTWVPVINIFFSIYMGFVKGTSGPNDYGPDPLERY